MDPAEFDKFADEYQAVHSANIAISGEGPDYFADYKVRDLARECATARLDCARPASILDFGSGIGASVPFFRKYFPQARATCLDVSTRSLELGKGRFGDQARFVQFDGSSIPFSDACFDVAFSACVFHHIAHEEHGKLIGELHRVLVPGGLLIIFEHNPYNPLTRRAVNSCPFDKGASLIPARVLRRRVTSAGFAQPRVRYRVFFPRALRKLRPLERRITWLPLGAQYYVAAVK